MLRYGNRRSGPKADILRCSKRLSLFDHLVGGYEQGLRRLC